MKGGRLWISFQAQMRFTPKKSPFFSNLNAAQDEMSSLHDAMMEILRPLADDGSTSPEMDGKIKYVWNWWPLAVSYYSNIAKGKEISCV